MIKKNNSVEELTRKEFNEFISKLEADFPSAEQMSQAAREIHEIVFDHSEDIIKNPDKKLLQWLNLEYELFQSIEQARYGEQIHRGFETMQSLLSLRILFLTAAKAAQENLSNGIFRQFLTETICLMNHKLLQRRTKSPILFFQADKPIIIRIMTSIN